MERRLVRLPLFLLLAIASASCMPDLKSDLPPDRIYWLEVPELQDPPAVDLQLSVVPGLDSDRIWLLQRDQRLNYYAGAYWADNLGPLLESLLARSLKDERTAADVQVLIERFFAVETGDGRPPQVTVRALLENEEGQCRFEAVESLSDGRMRDVVAGHQVALDELAAALARFARTGRCP